MCVRELLVKFKYYIGSIIIFLTQFKTMCSFPWKKIPRTLGDLTSEQIFLPKWIVGCPRREDKNNCYHMFTSSTQLQNRSFHIVKRTKRSVKCPNMKNARAKRAELLFFIVKYANLCCSCCHPPRTRWIARENVIYQALSAVILVGHVIRGKNILEYNISKKSLVTVTMVVN